jgi:plastocyanin
VDSDAKNADQDGDHTACGHARRLTGGAKHGVRPISGNQCIVPSGNSVKRVKIINFAFTPKTITIAKGTKVTWTNGGSVNHTTTSTKGLWDSGALAPGAAFAHVFKKVGTFKYLCTIHPTLMHGKILVT